MEYIATVRISFPRSITKVLSREKKRFIVRYGSSYASEPHITLYLGRYTKRGFVKFVRELQTLSVKPFAITLLQAKMILEKGLQRDFFFVDLSNKKELYALHVAVLKIAIRYRSPLLRKKDQQRLREGLYGKVERNNLKRYGYARIFEPHITLGEVGINEPHPRLADVQKNLRSIRGTRFSISSFNAMLYEKESEKKGVKLIQESKVKLSTI